MTHLETQHCEKGFFYVQHNQQSYLEDLLKLNKYLASYYCPLIKKSLIEKAVECGNLEIIQLLLRFGAEINARRARALFLAVWHGHTAISECLIQAGADLGKIPDILAVAVERRASLELYSLLIKSGARVDYPHLNDRFLDTPLIAAIKTQDSELFNLLIQSGASVHRNSANTQEYPLLHAIEDGTEAMGRVLIDHGASLKDYQHLFAMIVCAPCLVMPYFIQTTKLTFLSQQSWRINQYNAQGETLLFEEARKGNYLQVRELLAQGINPNKPRFHDNLTALDIAIQYRHENVVRELISYPIAPWVLLQGLCCALNYRQRDIFLMILTPQTYSLILRTHSSLDEWCAGHSPEPVLVRKNRMLLGFSHITNSCSKKPCSPDK